MKVLRAQSKTRFCTRNIAGRGGKLFQTLGLALVVVLAMLVSASAQVRTRAHIPTPLASEDMARTLPAVVTPTTAGTWTPLVNPAPENAGDMMLLSDGTVAYNGYNDNTWYRLTPDSTGSYVNGTWSTLASMNYTRLYFQSDMLPSGKIFVSGAEYGNAPAGSAEMYDPVANTWAELANYTTVASDLNTIDGESMVLPDGDVLVYSVSGGGALCGGGTYTSPIYSIASNTWSYVCTFSNQDETAWVKLPDDSILALDISGPTSERYIPSLNEWIADAPTPIDLFNANGELGGSFLLPNGKVFQIGGTNQTLLYTPSGNTSPGTWALGPTLPDQAGVPIGANDAGAAMMVNGNVLLTAGPYPPTCGYCGPTYFFVYDYRKNSLTQIDVPGGGSSLDQTLFLIYMLDLPDGSVLVSTYGSLYTFTPNPGQLWGPKHVHPVISAVTKNGDGSYHVTGTGFNGISQGANYGDEEQNATNYPIARLTATKAKGGNVYYARTYNWSSTGVATGSTPVSTEMTVPAGLPKGNYLLTIIANGISSKPKAFRYQP